MNNEQSLFSIVTPSFKQLDWLRLCVASVRDQVYASGGIVNSSEASRLANQQSHNQQPAISTLCVEHIIQDAGSEGIEEFAREVGAGFYRDGLLIFRGNNAECGMRNAESTKFSGHAELKIQNQQSRYRVAVFCESDRGMYDAINRGLSKTSGELCAWLNSDEQYLPGTLDFVSRYFRDNPATDVLLGDALLTEADHRPVCYRRIMVPSRWHTRLDHLHSLSCAMFFKRAALPDPPLDPRWRVISDAVLMDHFLSSGKRIVACRELLSAYAFTGKNLSAEPSGELERWWAETCRPSRLFQPYVVVLHRIRRYMCHAYRSRHVETALWKTAASTF